MAGSRLRTRCLFGGTWPGTQRRRRLWARLQLQSHWRFPVRNGAGPGAGIRPPGRREAQTAQSPWAERKPGRCPSAVLQGRPGGQSGQGRPCGGSWRPAPGGPRPGCTQVPGPGTWRERTVQVARSSVPWRARACPGRGGPAGGQAEPPHVTLAGPHLFPMTWGPGSALDAHTPHSRASRRRARASPTPLSCPCLSADQALTTPSRQPLGPLVPSLRV